MNALREKLTKEKDKENERLEKLKNLEKTKEKIEVDSDPKRLYRMTDVWKNRLKSPRTRTADPLIHMPHRAIPNWRQKI